LSWIEKGYPEGAKKVYVFNLKNLFFPKTPIQTRFLENRSTAEQKTRSKNWDSD